LNFEVEVWTLDPRNQFHLKSDLYYRIEANLRRHRIQIPFPQRDLHLRSPQLDRVVRAWSRSRFDEAETDALDGSALQLPPLGDLGREAGDGSGPRDWTEAEIDALAEQMRGPDGVTIADRRHLLTVYRSCFVGRESVDWMTRALGLTRPEATALGQLLIDRGIVRHVLDEHGFKDGNYFYCFSGIDGGARAKSGREIAASTLA
jgi:hypothetical protein